MAKPAITTQISEKNESSGLSVNALPESFLNSCTHRLGETPYHFSLLIALVVCALGVWFVAINPSPWFEDAVSAKNRCRYVASTWLKVSNKNPSIVVFGSSRPSFGIQANYLAQKLGHPENSGFNFAFPGLGKTIVSQIEQSKYLQQSKLWIVGIDDYFLLASPVPLQNKQLSLVQRVEQTVFFSLPWLELINTKGRMLLFNIKQRFHFQSGNRIDAWTLTQAGAWQDATSNTTTTVDRRTFEAVVDSYFKNKWLNKKFLTDYEDILRIAHAHNIQVVLVMPPYHPYYEHLVKLKYQRLAQGNLEEFRKLSKRYRVPFINCRANNCGVTEQDFKDAVHLNTQGAQHYTHYLINTLKDAYSQNKK